MSWGNSWGLSWGNSWGKKTDDETVTLGSLLYSLITGQSVIAALVGTRVYPTFLPQAPTTPAITYQWIYADRIRSTKGPSGLTRSRYQLDYWGSTYEAVKRLCEAVRMAIDGYRGNVDGVRVGDVAITADQDMREEDARFYRVSVDLTIWHEE
jgi:hypothetical protein